jgi:cell division protease FtsH
MILSNRINFMLLVVGLSMPHLIQANPPVTEQIPAAPTARSQELLKEVLEEEHIEKLHMFALQQSMKLSSIIQSLNLMIAHQRAIRLSEKQLEVLYQSFQEIQAILQSTMTQARNKNMPTISKIVGVNQQLAHYLLAIVRNHLRNIKVFALAPTAEQLTITQSIEIMATTAAHMQALELALKDLGVTAWQRIKRSWRNFDERYQVYDRLKLGVFAIGAGMLLRYGTKSSVSYNQYAHIEAKIKFDKYAQEKEKHEKADENDQKRQRADAAFKGAQAILKQHEDLKKQHDDLEHGIHSSWWHWFDETIIGNQPINAGSMFVNGNGTISTDKALHQRPGVFGTLHYYMGPTLLWLGFASALKKTVDTVVSDVHGWKGLYKNPGEYMKINELWHNEKQVVHPIEELFVTNALEHYAPRITFDDIVGLHDQKKELRPIINYLLNPELFEKTGTSVEKGYLFYGPSRTGKTYLAEALAGELVHKHGKKLAFVKIKGGDLRYVGIKKVLEVVKKFAPCIVFIDELDLLNLQRDQNTQLLEEFLTGMRTDDGKQVVFLAATNRIDHIDHALLQPGRFGKIVTFENPPFADRKEFFNFELRMRNISHPNIDIDRLALETENCTYGDLASILNHALTKAMQSRQVLGYDHFESGIDTFKRKILDAPLNIPESEKAVIAAHLAGHALAYALLPSSEKLHKVTMQPIQKRIVEEKAWMSDLTVAKKITTFGDVFTLHQINTGGFDSYEQKMNKVKALLAGHAAEKLLLGATAYNYHEDYDAARVELESLVFRGIKKDQLSRPMLDAKSDEVQQLIKTCEDQVTAFLIQHRPALERLAAKLKTNTILTAQEVTEIIG